MISWWSCRPRLGDGLDEVWVGTCLDLGYTVEATTPYGLVEAIEAEPSWAMLAGIPADPVDWAETWDTVVRGFRCRPTSLQSAGVAVRSFVLLVETDPVRVGPVCFVLHDS